MDLRTSNEDVWICHTTSSTSRYGFDRDVTHYVFELRMAVAGQAKQPHNGRTTLCNWNGSNMAHDNSSLVVSCCWVHDGPSTGRGNYSILHSLEFLVEVFFQLFLNI